MIILGSPTILIKYYQIHIRVLIYLKENTFQGCKGAGWFRGSDSIWKIQFTEMLEKEKEALIHALKQYCELDTLAMVFIYEHWLSVREDKC